MALYSFSHTHHEVLSATKDLRHQVKRGVTLQHNIVFVPIELAVTDDFLLYAHKASVEDLLSLLVFDNAHTIINNKFWWKHMQDLHLLSTMTPCLWN